MIGVEILLFIIAWLFSKVKAPTEGIALMCVAGIICIILGALLRKKWLEVLVVGFSTPIKFEGSRTELDQLLKIIREKRY